MLRSHSPQTPHRRTRAFGVAVLLTVAAALVALWMVTRSPGEPSEGTVEDSARLPAVVQAPGPSLTGSGIGPVRPAEHDGTARAQEALPRSSVVVGRVVDEQRIPVPGAMLRVSCGESARDVHGSSAEDGRFRIEIEFDALPRESARCVLLATAPPSRGAVVGFAPPHGAALDLGVLVLRPTAVLRVRVVSEGGLVSGATVSLQLADATMVDMPRAMPLWGATVMEGRTGADGSTEFHAVPDAPIRLLARTADGGWAERWIESPASAPSSVDLRLQAGRALTVEVVEDGTGQPLPGCALSVLRADGTKWEGFAAPAVTGADGMARLVGLPRESLFVNAVTPAWTWPLGVQPEALAPTTATKHRLAVPRGVSFVWTIGAGDGSTPSDGEAVAIRSHDRVTDFGGVVEPVGRIERGKLNVEVRYPTHLRATATLADGRMAYITLVLADGEWSPAGPAVFRAPRHLAVTVREEGEGPAQGAGVVVFDASGRALAGPVLSDEEGRANFAALPPAEVSVRVAAEPGMIASARVGVLSGEAAVSVDLRQGDGRAELAVRARKVATIAVLDERGLPFSDSYTLEVLLWPEALHWRSPANVEFDPTGGTARFALRLPAKGHKVWVRASASGRATATAEIPVTSEGTFGPTTLRLEPSGSLTVRLLPPSDGVCSVRLERRTPDTKWSAVELVPVRGFDDGFSHAFEGIAPGTYRLHDSYCGAVSESAEVRARASGLGVMLDLSRAGWVEGLLEVPDGVPSDEVALVVTGRGLAFDDVAYADGDDIPRTVRGSAFRVRVPGDRDVLVAAQHPRCKPDPRDGMLRLVTPSGGHRLRLLLK